MATFEEIMEAARKADAAGDADGARRLIEMARAKRAQETAYNSPEAQAERERLIALAEARQQFSETGNAPVVDGFVFDPRRGDYVSRDAMDQNAAESMTRTSAVGFGGMQGAAYNWADELAGSAGRVEGLFREGTPQQFADLRREQFRALDRAASDQTPVARGVAEIAGNVGTAAATLPYAVGNTIWTTAARGAVLGAAEGTVYGAGSGEGLADRGEQAARYGALGGVLGGTLPFVVSGIANTGRALRDAAGGALGIGSVGRGNRAVEQTMRAAEKTPDDVAQAVSRAAAAGQPEYRVMDALGQAGQRRASGVVRSGGPSAEELAEFLQRRQVDVVDRLKGYVDEGFGMQGQTRVATEQAVKDNRKAVADALYGAARREAPPVDVRGTVSMLDDTIEQMSGSGIRPPDVVREFQRLRSQLAGTTPDGNPSTLSDFASLEAIERQVRNRIDEAYRSGKGHIGEALKPIQQSLRAELESASDLVVSANDLYSQGQRVIDAFDTGAKAATRGRADDNVAAFRAMTPQQQRAARIGYGDALEQRIEGIAAEAPNASRHMASSKRQTEAAAMTLDPQLYAERLAREGDMYKTFTRALGGSKTADNLEDIADVGALADLGRAARDASAANVGSAAGNVLAAWGRVATGNNAATRQRIAEILMSQDPRPFMDEIARQSQSSQRFRRIMDALGRNSMREPLAPMVPF